MTGPARLSTAPRDRPFFLYLAPSAPHAPAEPAPRHADLARDATAPPGAAALAEMNDVRDGPGWIRNLTPIDAPTAVPKPVFGLAIETLDGTYGITINGDDLGSFGTSVLFASSAASCLLMACLPRSSPA